MVVCTMGRCTKTSDSPGSGSALAAAANSVNSAAQTENLFPAFMMCSSSKRWVSRLLHFNLPNERAQPLIQCAHTVARCGCASCEKQNNLSALLLASRRFRCARRQKMWAFAQQRLWSRETCKNQRPYEGGV